MWMTLEPVPRLQEHGQFDLTASYPNLFRSDLTLDTLDIRVEYRGKAQVVFLPPSPHSTAYNLPGAEVSSLNRLHSGKGSIEDVLSSLFRKFNLQQELL